MSSNRITHRPSLRCAIAAVALAGSAAATGCLPTGLLGGPWFLVGECVTVEQRIPDSDLDPASCVGATGSSDPAARTYRVESIVEHTSGACPPGAGFFPVEFVHEPDGVTYCLVQVDGS